MGLGISIAAAVAALASAVFVFLQVREMQRQTKLQREIAQSSAQPYVWADVRIASSSAGVELVLGNSGPTVATNVRVRVDPPFPDVGHPKAHVDVMHEKLSRGLASIAPGRTFYWLLGEGADLVNRSGSMAHTITIDCEGPFGAVDRSEYVIDFAHFREAIARYDGSLRDVARELSRVVDRLPESHQ